MYTTTRRAPPNPSTYRNLMKLLYRGALFLTDIITGDANSAANQCHKKHLVMNPMCSILSAATEDFRRAVNSLQTDQTNMITITSKTGASLRSLIEAALNFKTERRFETDPFYGVLDCIITHVFHWSKAKEMTHTSEEEFSERSIRDTDNQDDPQDIEHHDYSVTSAGRYKLMTNGILLWGRMTQTGTIHC